MSCLHLLMPGTMVIDGSTHQGADKQEGQFDMNVDVVCEKEGILSIVYNLADIHSSLCERLNECCIDIAHAQRH